ncbi:patronin isoform X7 [Sitodiplosis mosellana]|uniref:patronin isoform X7 n=1 Tax=Sitodiplosis mosellana TaxID=263140 RepID=UPI00244377C6|nr:patronin isoform X7 [Sitodiplosis mosellana]
MDKMDSDTSDVRQARQRASVKWILSKAFNNRVPENQREPFYRDHEGQDHLKPQIVVNLGNASIYCQTLSNLYSDPNYQSLNHWSILQTLTRKGILIAENPDMPLTETVLIQTNPIRINAHMSVIEALMILYAKEVASCERISAAINRITGGSLPKEGQNHETALLCWLSHVCAALKRRIDKEIENGATDENGVRLQSPDIPPVHDYIDLCDGVCLAYLISYYCPNIVPWTSVRLNYMPTVEDSISNILLVSNFSQKHLPYSVFHMTPQDVTYMRGSMKQNLVVLLADLFNLFEIHPAKCVAYPGMDQQISKSDSNDTVNEHGIQQRRGLTLGHYSVTPIPDLRPGLDSPTSSAASNKPPFQVDRSVSATAVRRVTPPREDQNTGVDGGFVVHRGRTIPTLASMQEPLPAARSRQSKERADSRTEERGDSIAAGRPSNWEETRRPSFAGRRSRRNSVSDDSQLTIENFGGSQDQLNMIGRSFEREKSMTNVVIEPAVPVRSSMADARGSILFDYDDTLNSEKQDHETEKQPPIPMRRKSQTTDPHSKDIIDGDITMSQQSGNINMDLDDGAQPVRKTSFATLPNTTTWQQQSVNYQKIDHSAEDDGASAGVDVFKLSTVRMQLEEKRRQIEQEKRKMEATMNQQQQKVGKAAFLQAINKDSTDLNTIESKWAHVESKQTPDLDQMSIDQYQKSIDQKNTSLQDLNEDINRLANLQVHMQAKHAKAQQIMQAQQIANMLFGSQQHISGATSNHRSPISQSNFGSSPHISHPHSPQQPIHYNNVRPISRDSHQFINEQGQYVTPVSNNHQSYSSYVDNENGSGGLYQYESHQQQSINPYHTYRVDQYHNNHSVQTQPRIQQPQSNQFYLHENTPPQPAARRTWAQPAAALNTEIPQNQQPPPLPQIQPLDVNAWSQNSPKIDTHTWKSSSHSIVKNPGFMLHQNKIGMPQHQFDQFYSSPVSSTGSDSKGVHHNTNGKNEYRDDRVSISSQSVDDMAPQSISFIGDEDSVDLITEHPPPPRTKHLLGRPNVIQHEQDLDLGKLNISSGKLTYRIPSPTRPSLNMNSFQKPNEDINNEQKGFYISFDNSQPKRPKPPLRTKRSPKKDRSLDATDKQEQITQLEQELNKERPQVNKRQNSFSSFENKVRGSYHDQAFERNESNGIAVDSEPTITRKHVSDSQMSSILDRRHLEDVTNHQQEPQQQTTSPQNRSHDANKTLIIDDALVKLDPESVDEMERKKEKIMLLSLQRRQQQEEAKARKEIEAMQRREREREKEDERIRKREEQAARRATILEQHKLKKAIEEAEQKGITLDRNELQSLKQHAMLSQTSSGAAAKMRPQKVIRPRPKTIHVETGSVDLSEASSLSSRNKKGSNSNLTGIGQLSSNSMRRDYYRGSQDSLAVREPAERGRTMSRISVAKGSNLNFRGRKSNSLMNLCDTDSGLGRATPPRRAPSPGMGQSNRHLPSPSGPGSLPPGFMNKRRVFDDGSSDISSTPSSMLEYSGPKLYKQPTTKSNRGIILNAVEYCVFPGVVNREAKQKVLDKINRSDAKHFLILFRDAGCQFRALYSYWPENESVLKLYGTGPSQVDEFMFDKFFKYNSGGKCFSQIHTKHLTVTIDAFTIHNSLWQGKKVQMPSKKDMALVI